MKRRDFLALSSVAAAALAMPSIAFGADEFSVKCASGEFIGFKEAKTGVVSFKGIPFAKAPVGKLRWLPPQELEPSNKKFEAKNFGPYSLQNLAIEEEKMGVKSSEDCLNLNIWASDLKGKNRPVMFYIHGGSYGWEGTSSPVYDGQFIVEQNPDIIVVTNDYRLNTLGFADLSRVPGYSQKYAKAGCIGLLDDIAALKWVKKNIAKFGGDPENITIFGESAGGGSVSCLLASKETKGLFKRAIAQSGALNLTFDAKKYAQLDQIGEIMRVTGAKNIDDLLALSGDEIKKAWQKNSSKTGAEGSSLIETLQGFPLRGGASIVPADPYKALEEGVNKDVDLMIGTTTDEWRYWVFAISERIENATEKELRAIYEPITMKKQVSFENSLDANGKKYFKEYLKEVEAEFGDAYKDYKDYIPLAKAVELVNDVAFRMPSIKQAIAHTKGGGKSYMYYFGKASDANDWIGAAHASELNYVFHNIDLKQEFVGTVDKVLAKKIVTMWANFARNGNPSIEDFTWKPYDEKNRATMVVARDGSISLVNDPKGKQRELLEKTGADLKYGSGIF